MHLFVILLFFNFLPSSIYMRPWEPCLAYVATDEDYTNMDCYKACKNEDAFTLHHACMIEPRQIIVWNKDKPTEEEGACYDNWVFGAEDYDILPPEYNGRVYFTSDAAQCQLFCQKDPSCAWFIVYATKMGIMECVTKSSEIMKNIRKTPLSIGGEFNLYAYSNYCTKKMQLLYKYGTETFCTDPNGYTYCQMRSSIVLSGPKYCSKGKKDNGFTCIKDVLKLTTTNNNTTTTTTTNNNNNNNNNNNGTNSAWNNNIVMTLGSALFVIPLLTAGILYFKRRQNTTNPEDAHNFIERENQAENPEQLA